MSSQTPLPLLTDDETARYLERLSLQVAGPPSAEALAELVLAHLRAVPFGNLDIHQGRRVVLDPEAVYRKIVERRRGGYCYELNSLFARLLMTLGYDVDLLSARVARRDGSFGPEFDHMTLLVRVPGVDTPAVVDVGFGDAMTQPLPLVPDAVLDDRRKQVRLARNAREDASEADWAYAEDHGDGWSTRYRFTTSARRLWDFEGGNDWQQSSPDSFFVQAPTCTRLTATGRVTLFGDRLLTTDAASGERVEASVAHAEVAEVLRSTFGVDVPRPLALADLPPEILANPVATFATNGPDGRPQLTLVWWCIEDGELCISVEAQTTKARNLERDVRCTVLITDPDSDDCYVEIRGLARVTPDEDYSFADRLGARYSSDFRSFDGPGARRRRVAVRAVRVNVFDMR